jgi:hypothetical protein
LFLLVQNFRDATGDHRQLLCVNAAEQGEYAIYFRGYKANEGIIEADVRSVNAQQLAVVARDQDMTFRRVVDFASVVFAARQDVQAHAVTVKVWGL